MNAETYKTIAKEARIKTLDLIFKAQTSHIGSNFSATDIFAVLFQKIDLDKDRFLLSAGWKAATLYYFLWQKGRMTLEELDSFCMPGSKFIGLAEPVHKDIPFAGGSMSQGLASGCAFAWSKKERGQDGKVYVLESDGGMQSGLTWEALQFAGHHKLNNLVLLIDNNKLQAMGLVEKILGLESLDQKLGSFGWCVWRIDGHNHEQIEHALEHQCDLPFAIICDTIKGKGVDFMESNNLWHYAQIKQDDYEKALTQLNA